MKHILFLILLMLSTGTQYAQEKKKVIYYTCTMHPEVRASQPGKCPKCGMVLVKKQLKDSGKSQRNTSADTLYDTSNKDKPTGNSSHEKNTDTEEHTYHNKELQMPVKTTVEEMPSPIESVTKIIKAKQPKKIRYDLYVADTIVNYTGKRKKAIAINGSIPAPTLFFTEGDTAEIYVHNTMRHETSIHWHGIILPNKEDGVPYLTTAPIKPGRTHVFRFPVIQSGTYWYHSHTKVQEQSGMYGALIFYKREEPDIKQQAIVISEWADMRPHEIDRSLHSQTDWFAIKKNAVQSYAEAISVGHFGTKIGNEWKRMLAMDVSDVAYDRFLVNGDTAKTFSQYKKGDKVKLRIINGSASSYFWLKFAGGKMTVVANDGEDVEPVAVDRLIIGTAETYDVIVTIPDNMRYEFLVTPEDRTKYASIWLGKGMSMPAIRMPKLKYFEGMKMMNGMMKMNGDMKEMPGMKMTNQVMDMNTVMYPEIMDASHDMIGKDNSAIHNAENMNTGNSDIITLNYAMLKAPNKTTLPDNWSKRTFFFNLTGNMNRYVWTIDNRAVSEAKRIWIKKGEIIRIVLFNNTMMRHPMHLHGHFFRLLNKHGAYSPLKNTLDIMPMERDTIEFAATESGDWFFHCHILYHMMSGMGRIFSYESSPPNPDIPDPKYAQRKLFQDDRSFHLMAEIGIETNGSDGRAMLNNKRWRLETLWHLGYQEHHGYESETSVGRYLGKMQWWYVYAGFDYHYKAQSGIRLDEAYNLFGQLSNKNNRKTVVAGVQYILPMLFVADARIDGDGKVRLQVSREDIPVAKRLRLNFMVNTDREYMAGLRYIVTKYIAVSSHYDSDMGLGAGLTIIY